MKYELKPLLSKVSNVALSAILISSGMGSEYATKYGVVAEGLISGLPLENKKTIDTRLLTIFKNSTYETICNSYHIELSDETIDGIIDHLFNIETLYKYLIAIDAGNIMINSLCDIFEFYNIPYKEQYIDVGEIACRILSRANKQIQEDSELVIISTLVEVRVLNEKVAKLELIGDKILTYFQNNSTQTKHLILKNQKQEFINKWNDILFLHKGNTNENGRIKLCDLYFQPNFSCNNNVTSNIDSIIWDFIQKENMQSMVIVGNPGLGKSSLMCYFANKFKDFSNFVFIKMYELEPKIAFESLLEAITDFLGCKKRDLKNTILFLDGYDELRVDNKHYELCLDLFAEISSISGLKIVVSSRLNYIDLNKIQYNIDFSNTITIEILPFKKDQMISYIKKYQELMETNNIRLKKQFKNKSTVTEVFGIPFILYLICSLDIDITDVQNVFSIYEKVFAFNGGLFDKIYDDSGHYLTKNPFHKRQLLEITKLIAYKMFEIDKIELPKAEIESLISEKYPEREKDYPIGNYYNIDGNKLSFVHKTFQEYFLCKYLTEQTETILTNYLSNSNNNVLMHSFFNLLFCENYIYKRLEELLKCNMKTNTSLNSEVYIDALKLNCSYILKNFMFLQPKTDNVVSSYQKIQNFLSSMCKIFNIIIGDRWASEIKNLNNLIISIIIKTKGYININLNGVCLCHTDLSGAYLRSNLSYCKLEDNNFCRADLSKCIARYSDFTDSKMKSIYGYKADFQGSIFNAVKFDQSNLRGSCFNGCELIDVNFFLVDLGNGRFDNAHLEDVNFTKSDMENTSFKDATLQKVKFTDSDLQKAVFYGTEFEDIDFNGANLQYADFRGVIKFIDVDFSNAKMSSALFDEKNVLLLSSFDSIVTENIYIETSKGLVKFTDYKK